MALASRLARARVSSVGTARRAYSTGFKSSVVGGIRVLSEEGSSISDLASPSSLVTVFVNAGSRFESGANRGASHYLRRLAFKGTANRTAFRMTRELESIGADAWASSDREFVVYGAQCLPQDLAIVTGTLGDAVCGQLFNAWEVRGQNTAVGMDIGVHAGDVRLGLLDDAHSLAFRGGLGNPVNAPSFQVGKITPEILSAYVEAHFGGDAITIVGKGVNHDELTALVEEHFHVPGSHSKPSDKYFGGASSRHEDGSAYAHLLIGYNGVDASSSEIYAAEVLATLLGSGASVKYVHGLSSKLGDAVGEKAVFGAFSSNYSDAGLFGVSLSCEAEDAQSVFTSGAAAIKKALAGDISDEEVSRAKARVQSNLLSLSADDRVSFIGRQATRGDTVHTPEEAAAAVAGLTTAAVKKVAASIGASKPVVAARGGLVSCPYPDELGL